MAGGCKRLAMAAMLIVSSAELAAAQQADSARFAAGRRVTQWIYTGQADSIYARLSPRMRQVVPDAQSLAAQNEQIVAQLGTEAEVVGERVVDPAPAPGITVYVRSVRFSRAPIVIDVKIGRAHV